MRMRTFARCALTAIVTSIALAGAPVQFHDPLDTPALANKLVSNGLMLAVTKAGQRLVAVGARGAVVLSDDEGASWRQAAVVPVSSDLVAVHFISAQQGWAVGHYGVILHTVDGGQHWTLQLDGRRTQTLLSNYFEAQQTAGIPGADKYLEEVKMNFESGAEQPILDIWFGQDGKGFAVSTFGTLLASDDFGATWRPWTEHAENPQRLHLYAIEGRGDDVFIVGERGMVLRLDQAKQRFVGGSIGYQGGLFGLVMADDYLLAFGLRGHAFRSLDHGASWNRVTTGLDISLNGGTLLADGRVALVSQDGRVAVSDDRGNTFKLHSVKRPGLLSSVAPSAQGIVAAGASGVQTLTLR